MRRLTSFSCTHPFEESNFVHRAEGTVRCRACSIERVKNWRTKNPRGRHRNALRFSYGITLEEFDTMLHEQNFRCAVCDGVQTDGYRENLGVHHDHETGEVIALLCSDCNRAIGLLKDNAGLLFKAYLLTSAQERKKLLRGA